MNAIPLPGARGDSLLGYLKSLALLRLVHRRLDPAVRGAWKSDSLVLHTHATRDELELFFLEKYVPTPVVNPWNSGAGFDAKSRSQTAGKTLDRIAGTTDERWQPYRESIAASRSVSTSGAEVVAKIDRLGLLRDLISDEALEWLDAAVVVGGLTLGFPPLLGSGGNDGRLDFSINFAQRALDVLEPQNRAASANWLRDALDDTSVQPRLADAAIGQFSPGATGGVNATVGFDGASLVNPWDYVLLIEGATAFAGSIGKRFGSGAERASFPFTFQTAAVGFGTSSSEEVTRGEIWLPLWRGAAAYPAVLALLRGGRLEIDMSSGKRTAQRAAKTALEAAQAALSAGAATGIARFTRIVIAQRNGLAFAATPAGTIMVREDTAIATLSRETFRWLERIQRPSNDGSLGATALAALRAYGEAIFTYGVVTERARAARALQSALAALAELDFALAAHPPRTKAPLGPLPFLGQALYVALDDGSPEHRIACALASYGFGNGQEDERLRLDISHIDYDRDRRLTYVPDRVVTWSVDLDATLGRILERRVRRAIADVSRERRQVDERVIVRPALHVGHGVDIADFLTYLEHSLDVRRLRRLVAAYSLIEPTTRVLRAPDPDVASIVPAPFAALKFLIDGERASHEGPLPALDPAIVPLLLARRPRAFALVQLRLRNANIPVRVVAEAQLPAATGVRYAAAALIPSSLAARLQFRDAALLSRS